MLLHLFIIPLSRPFGCSFFVRDCLNTMYDPNAEITVTTFADMIPQMLPYALYDLAIVLLSLFGCGWMLDKKVSL